MRFCAYKDILGVPRTGLHSYRLFDIAVVDVLLTFLGAWLISRITGMGYLRTLIAVFLLGIFLHWLFCVDTTVGRFLGLVY